jgi:hypothetical protein
MPVLTAREAEKYEGAVEKSAVPLSLSKTRGKEKKSGFIFYLQHPEHCKEWPIEGTLNFGGKLIPITQGIIKTQEETERDYLLGVKWILIHTAKGK